MSDLEKYSRLDPMASCSSYAKKQSITLSDAEAWLKKHGNGMDKIQKPEVQANKFWAQSTKASTSQLVDEYFNHFDVLVPSDIQDRGCSANVWRACDKKAKSGELVKITVSRTSNDPNRSGRKMKFQAFKRA